MPMKKQHIWEARLVRVLSRLPISLVLLFARVLAAMFNWLPLSWAKPRRIIVVNRLLTEPESNWQEANDFANKTFRETAITIAGYSHIWLKPVDETLAHVSKIHGLEAWRQSIAAGKPRLYLSLHQSSWEVPVLIVGREDPGTVVMYQPGRPSALEELVKDGREASGCELVPTNGDGIKRTLAVLEQGGAFGILADHKPGGKTNPYVPFFGIDASVPAFIHKVIKRYQPDIFFVSAQRPSDFTFEVFIERATEVEQAGGEHETLSAMMRGFENIIRRNPTQYQWSYKRFSGGPSGSWRWYKDANQLLEKVRGGAKAADVFKRHTDD